MTDPRSSDQSVFPDPVYKQTVLAPLFDGAKDHHIEGFRAIDRAHLVMLTETGILDAGQAREIAAALESIDAEIEPSSLVYTGEVEDFFFLIEKELKKRVGPDLGGRLHTARSRNDIDHTLFKLGLRERLNVLVEKALKLHATLIDAAEREKATLIVAYTHGQPAQPTTFGHYLSAIVEFVGRDIERLFEAYRIVDLSPMGAAAITTTGFPTNRARVSELLGFAAPLQNSYSCIAGVDYITSISAVRSRISRFGPVSRWGRSMCPIASCRSPRSCRKSAIRCQSNICVTWRARRQGERIPCSRSCTTRPLPT